MTKATPDKWDRRRAQGLINLGFWLQENRTALFLAQSVISEKWWEHIESDAPTSFQDFACSVDDAIDLFIEIVVRLRSLQLLPDGEHDGSVFVPYGCGRGHGVQLLPPLTAEPAKAEQTTSEAAE